GRLTRARGSSTRRCPSGARSARRARPRVRDAASPRRRTRPPRARRCPPCPRRLLSAQPLSTHLDEPVLRAGDRALHEQQVLVGVDVEHGEAELRDALAAHAAGHLDALEDARRCCGGTDRARLADVVRAVRARAGAEVVPLDRALKALADADARDLDLVAGLERRHRDRLAFDRAVNAAAELDEPSVRADAELREMTELRFRELALGDGVERELHGVVAVDIVRLHLHDRARAGLDHRDGRHRARLRIEDLRHAELASENAFGHQSLISMSTPAGRSSRISWSIVFGVGLRMSMRRLCVRTSKCSRESLSLNGLRMTQYTFFSVGRGTGPVIVAPLRCAVSTICWADRSSCWWSYPFRRIRIFPCAICLSFLELLDYFGDDAGADGAAALADRETQARIHGDRLDQLDVHVRVVARHDHLLALGKLHRARHVRRAEVELRAVVVEERSVAAAFVLRQHVHLGLELRVGRDRARLREHLSALDLLALHAAQKGAGVVAGLREVERLLEHLETGDHGLLDLLVDADDLDLVSDLDLALLDAPGHDGAAAGDRENVLDRHQERLVSIAHRLRDVGVDRFHQLDDLRLPLLVALERLQRRDADDRDVVAGELVLREQLANLELDELEQLLVVDHVGLVERDDDVRNLDLARKQDVLPRLRHRAVGRRDHEDRAVHLRGARDHVLDVVGVTGAVDVRVVTVLRLVLHVRRVDRDAALPLFRRLVDLVEGDRL